MLTNAFSIFAQCHIYDLHFIDEAQTHALGGLNTFMSSCEMQFVQGISISEYHVYCSVQCLRECRFAYT